MLILFMYINIVIKRSHPTYKAYKQYLNNHSINELMSLAKYPETGLISKPYRHLLLL